jgi:phosphoribosylamine---glycine ligase
MNILLLGSGGREHALAWKTAQSPHCKKLFIAPGNGGTGQCGTNVPLTVTDFQSIGSFVRNHDVDIVVVGPEDPLVKGIQDYFLADSTLRRVPVIGPDSKAARLEGSKDFAKAFMQRHQIPTASYGTFTKDRLQQGFAFLETLKPPYVLKADGLAAGKGVVILDLMADARKELEAMFSGKFGTAGQKVVIEQFLKGTEISVFIVTDGKDYCLLPEAKDYKKIGEGDTGPNTGGMGSVSGVPFADAGFMDRVVSRIIKPTLEGLQEEGITYKGFIFFGLIKVGNDPYVIEYNARLGDPETESVIPRLKNDMVEVFQAVASDSVGKLHMDFDRRYAASVMMVSGGYPGSYPKGKVICGLDTSDNSIVFHAGTRYDKDTGQMVTDGGRVIAVTSLGNTLKDAIASSYASVEKISYEGMYYRKDIGFDL